MKIVYLNNVLISRFYLQKIHKTKNKDKERRIIPFNMLKTTIKTIKIQWETQMICRRRREDEWEEPRKNEPQRGGRFFTVILPTELPMKSRIIFFWAVALNSVSNSRRYFLNFALKFWKSLQIFWSLSAHPSVKRCQSMGTLDLPRPLVMPSVTVPTDQAVWQSPALECGPSVCKLIVDYGRGCSFFVTISKIPMGHNLSV